MSITNTDIIVYKNSPHIILKKLIIYYEKETVSYYEIIYDGKMLMIVKYRDILRKAYSKSIKELGTSVYFPSRSFGKYINHKVINFKRKKEK